MDSFLLCIDGVYFLYRRCDFMHARLCVLCFSASVSAAFLTFLAATLFSRSTVTCLALLAFLTGSNSVC